MLWCACPCVLCDKTESGLLLAQAYETRLSLRALQNHCRNRDFFWGGCVLLSAWVINLFGWLVGWFLFGGIFKFIEEKCNF